jgi:hypothetical protein
LENHAWAWWHSGPILPLDLLETVGISIFFKSL